MKNAKYQPLSQQQKDEIAQLTRARFLEWYGDDIYGRASCLYWMQVGTGILIQQGFRALPQAGSASWRIVPRHLDDGLSPTHFGFEWSPDDPGSAWALRRDELPEIHCWIGLPDRGEVVDFSTHNLHITAERMGHRWRNEPPPSYIWDKCTKELPVGAVYKPNMEAIRFVINFIKRKFTNPAPPTCR